MSQASGSSIRSFLTWVWGGLLILGGAGYLVLTTSILAYEGPLMPIVAAAVAAISLPFLGRWAVKRENWALLTAWIFLAVGLLLGAMYLLPNQDFFIAALAMLEIAIPFTVAYSMHRQSWGLLIPAYVAGTLAVLITLMALHVSAATLLGFTLLALALPFNVVYWTDKRRWWALIPSALFAVAAIIILVFFSLLTPGSAPFYIVLNTTLAVVFLIAWITARWLDWAPWVAAGFAGSAVLSIWSPSVTNFAVLALALGGYIVYRQIRGAAQPQTQAAATAPGTTAQAAQSNQSAASTPSTPVTPAAPSAPPTQSPSVSGPPPGIEFRPLDPLKLRKPDDD